MESIYAAITLVALVSFLFGSHQQAEQQPRPGVVHCLYGKKIKTNEGFDIYVERIEKRWTARGDSRTITMECRNAPDFIGAILPPPDFPIPPPQS